MVNFLKKVKWGQEREKVQNPLAHRYRGGVSAGGFWGESQRKGQGRRKEKHKMEG